MKLDRQPPPVPEAICQPPASKRRYLGRFTKFGLIAIALLLLALVWEDLQSAAGRRELLAKATTLFSSVDTYIFGGVLIVNSLLYSLMIKFLYPAGADTRRGIARALGLLKSDELSPDSDGSELKHFVLIFILPVLFFAAGTVEYTIIKEWLHSR